MREGFYNVGGNNWKRLAREAREVMEWCSEEPHQVEDIPGHGRGLGLDEL